MKAAKSLSVICSLGVEGCLCVGDTLCVEVWRRYLKGWDHQADDHLLAFSLCLSREVQLLECVLVYSRGKALCCLPGLTVQRTHILCGMYLPA